MQYALPWLALLAISLTGDINAAQRWIYAGGLNTLLTHLFKFIFNHTKLGKRPDGGSHAFPSGHTSSAFMGAAYIHFYFGILWGIIAYAFAALTGYSRVQASRHWWRDVIAGAVLAIVITYLTFLII